MTVGFCFINPINNWLSNYWETFTKNNFFHFHIFDSPTLYDIFNFFKVYPECSHIVLIKNFTIPIVNIEKIYELIKVNSSFISNEKIISISLDDNLIKLNPSINTKLNDWRVLLNIIWNNLDLPNLDLVYNALGKINEKLDNKKICNLRNKKFMFISDINSKTDISYSLFSENPTDKYFIPIREIKSSNFPTYREICLFRKPKQTNNLSFIPIDHNIENLEEGNLIIKKNLGGNSLLIYENSEDEILRKNKINRSNNYHWVSIYDIFTLSYYHFSLEPIIYLFFEKFSNLITYDLNKNKLTPLISVYHGTDLKIIENILETDFKPSKIGMLGPGYYFGDFRKSVRYAIADSEWNNKRENGGMIRFYLEPGRMKIIPENLISFNIPVNYKKPNYLIKPIREEEKNYINKENSFFKKYDSVLVKPFKIKHLFNRKIMISNIVSNPEYLILNKTQFKIINYALNDYSIYLLNQKWNPLATNYRIL